MATEITRRFEFDSAHRVLGHEGKCRHLHGHGYVAEVSVKQVNDQLDVLGRVVDFSVLKDKVGKWIEDNWDHNILLHPFDPLYQAWTYRDVVISHVKNTRLSDVFNGRAPYSMGALGNPTAENIAQELYFAALVLLKNTELEVTWVTVWETPNCSADYYPR